MWKNKKRRDPLNSMWKGLQNTTTIFYFILWKQSHTSDQSINKNCQAIQCPSWFLVISPVQEIKGLREALQRAAEQHQTSPVNKRRLRVQLEELRETFEKELAEKEEQHEKAKEEMCKKLEEQQDATRLALVVKLREELTEERAEASKADKQRSKEEAADHETRKALESKDEAFGEREEVLFKSVLP